ncbi:hypothetical protein QR680_001463 [Steinernema hermaphroditum]|uniref:Metalloendopeptidase n=1 Tax=Steinernema hermaphroditum TaxID=289476 RepID=A0AA39LFJ1_9BILA|nr:hypothetical protein QR680_001463 [Steinernema hermaphroditum]
MVCAHSAGASSTCHSKLIAYAVALAAGGAALGYLIGWKLGKKRARHNHVHKLSADKVVDTVDLEDVGEKMAFCRCWKSHKKDAPGGFVLPSNATEINGIPIEKYLNSLKRLNEIELELHGIKQNSTENRQNNTQEHQVDPMMSPYLYEGDILLSESQLNDVLSYAEARLKNLKSPSAPPVGTFSNPLIERPSRRWRMPIPYRFVSADGGLQMVKRGMQLWTESTCVRFEEYRSWNEPHIVFQAGGGCFATWGYKSRFDTHQVSLGPRCGTPAIVAHELGHTLGLYHTQSRYDRNKYVYIDYNNILSAQSYNFNNAPEATTTLGIPYELGSVMHYGPIAFPVYGSLTTVYTVDKRYQNTIGQREGLTFYDVKIVNLAYCNDSCRTQLPCLHNGYTDPLDCSKCRCPSGLTGTLCESVQKTATSCGKIDLVATTEYQTVSFRGTGHCNYFIRGNGRKIQLVLQQYPSFLKFDRVCEGSYLEIKYKPDLGLTGARRAPSCHNNPSTTISFSSYVSNTTSTNFSNYAIRNSIDNSSSNYFCSTSHDKSVYKLVVFVDSMQLPLRWLRD